MQALLRELGMTATSELRAMRQQLKELDLAVPAALKPEEQQRVFLEVRGELRAEAGFKSLLEATPGITAGTSWPLVKRKVCCPAQIFNVQGASSLGGGRTLLLANRCAIT